MNKNVNYYIIIFLVFIAACSSNNVNPPSSNNSSTMSINSIYSMALGNWRLDSVKTYSSSDGNSTNYSFVGSICNLTSNISLNVGSNCSSNYYKVLYQEKYNGVFAPSVQDMWFIQDANCAINIWPSAYKYSIYLGASMNTYSIGNIESINSNSLVLVNSTNQAQMILPQIDNGWRAYWSKNTATYNCTGGSTTVTDVDGNVYNIVSIGTQCWLKENLKVTHYKNGTPIPIIANNSNWQTATSGACCNYNNSASNSQTYGKLYNYYAVADPAGLCPNGWHVPTDGEWTTMIDYLGGGGVAGGALKEVGISHWSSPNFGATNSSGFTALGGGRRYDDGTYGAIKDEGSWWTSSPGGVYAFSVGISNNSTGIGSSVVPRPFGYSIRCVHD